MFPFHICVEMAEAGLQCRPLGFTSVALLLLLTYLALSVCTWASEPRLGCSGQWSKPRAFPFILKETIQVGGNILSPHKVLLVNNGLVD